MILYARARVCVGLTQVKHYCRCDSFYMRRSNASFRVWVAVPIEYLINFQTEKLDCWLKSNTTLSHTQTHTEREREPNVRCTRISTHSLTHSHIHTHARRRHKVSIKHRIDSVTQQFAYCVTKCKCVCVCVSSYGFSCCLLFYRICVKLCRQSVAKWHDKINNTVPCDFHFEAHVTYTDSHMWWSYRADLISFFFTRIEIKNTDTNRHSRRHTHTMWFKIKLYL